MLAIRRRLGILIQDVCIHEHLCTYIYMHEYMCTYIYIYMCTYTYMSYTRVLHAETLGSHKVKHLALVSSIPSFPVYHPFTINAVRAASRKSRNTANWLLLLLYCKPLARF